MRADEGPPNCSITLFSRLCDRRRLRDCWAKVTAASGRSDGAATEQGRIGTSRPRWPACRPHCGLRLTSILVINCQLLCGQITDAYASVAQPEAHRSVSRPLPTRPVYSHMSALFCTVPGVRDIYTQRAAIGPARATIHPSELGGQDETICLKYARVYQHASSV
jgi:hypothetical protein